MGKHIAVAMSGGVDSFTAALVLIEAGYRVTGYTMYSHSINDKIGINIIQSAAKNAELLGIEHRAVNISSEFDRNVIDYFTDEYSSGRTPNPCIICNRKIKFGILMDTALKEGADLFATGHYARLDKELIPGKTILRKGVDNKKDQSYFLFYLTPEQLDKLILPLGEIEKKACILKARKFGIKTSVVDESMDICFHSSKKYSYFLKQKRIADAQGEIRFIDGTVLGKHSGCHKFTIGQRKGLGIAYSNPLYVVDIIPAENAIIVGLKKDVYKKKMSVSDLNMLYPIEKLKFRCSIKIRYRHTEADATVSMDQKRKTAEVIFDQKQMSITPGQAAVFYKDDIVLGGGWIDKAI